MNSIHFLKFKPGGRFSSVFRRRPTGSVPRTEVRRLAGLSLMEGIAVLGIMMIILVLVSEIFTVTMNLVTSQLRRTDTSTGAIHAVRQISDMARGASTVVASHVIDGTSHVTSEDTLVLQMPSIDGSGNIIPGQSDYVAFYRDPSDSSRVLSAVEPGTGSYRADSTRLMSAYNAVLTFRYNSRTETEATRISVYVENSRFFRDRPITTKAWTAIFLRNR